MRKSLLAMAALGLVAGGATPAAFAQSSVTLYGVVDTAIQYVNRVNTASGTGARVDVTTLGGQSLSRWGIRGTEDLGSGNQAFFWLESGFAGDTGNLTPSPTSPLFGRQAAVGLKNRQYGQLSFGRQMTALFESTANFLPMRFATLYEPAPSIVGLSYREDNMVKYMGDLGPVHAVAHYSFGTGTPLQGGQATTIPDGEIPGNHRAQTGYGVSAYYLDQKFGLGAGYDRVNPASSASAAVGKVQIADIAGTYYVTPAVRLYAGYRYRNSEFGNGATQMRDDFFWGGVVWHPTPALGLTAAYYYDKVKQAAPLATVAAVKLPNFGQLSLLADYDLSKRTDIYLSGGWSHNGALNYDSLMQTGTLYGYSTAASLTGLANGQKDMLGVAVGIRHVF